MLSRERVIDLLEQSLDLDPGALQADTVLSDSGNYDSVNQMRVLVLLEKELGAALEFDRFMAAGTCGDLLDVMEHAGSASARVSS